MVDFSQVSTAINAYKNMNRMPTEASPVSTGDAPTGPKFDELVSESLSTAKANAYKSEAISTKSLIGEAELHELVTSVTNAELTLSTVVAIRDKVIGAYQDILRMAI